MVDRKDNRIMLTVGSVKIKAVLNNSTTAQDLISRLPCKIKLHRYEYDYCGVISEPLQFDERDKHNGWENGEIAYVSNYFSILFEGESQSQGYSNMITLGRITDDLNLVKGLGDEIEVNIGLE